jgi:hypothetical protein
MAEAANRVKRTSMTKLTCPECSQNVWAKPGAQVICGVCYSDEGEICVMSAREGEEEGQTPTPEGTTDARDKILAGSANELPKMDLKC